MMKRWNLLVFVGVIIGFCLLVFSFYTLFSSISDYESNYEDSQKKWVKDYTYMCNSMGGKVLEAQPGFFTGKSFVCFDEELKEMIKINLED